MDQATYGYVKKRDLRDKYRGRPDLDTFLDKICKQLKAAGAVMPDPLAPDDPEELMYDVPVEFSRTRENQWKEEQSFEGSMEVDSAMADTVR
eukprot:941564-Alexandrium_andersonii.AAC.1